jgi:hypothetical protein
LLGTLYQDLIGGLKDELRHFFRYINFFATIENDHYLYHHGSNNPLRPRNLGRTSAIRPRL